MGRSDLYISELCFGTLNFGWQTDEATAFDLLDAFHGAGGNFIQTCAVAAGDGFGAASTAVSESYVGRWLRERGIPRDELVIASRHAVPSCEGRNDIFKTASAIRRSCEDSLRRLQVRYLDLLVFEWCEGMPMDETLFAAESLVRAGMVRHTAASGFPAWRVMEWVGNSARRNLSRLEAMQNEFSLVSNAGVNAEATALARTHRLGFIARAPLAGGFLSGGFPAHEALTTGRARMLRGRFSTPSAAAALEEVRAIADARGATPARVALAWTLAHPNVSSAVIGVSSRAQLGDLTAATALDLSLADRHRLDGRWKISGDHQPDDELEPAATAAAPCTILNELHLENSHS